MAEELPTAAKIFIVQELACFARPSEIVKTVKEEFDLTVTRQRVHAYDPTKAAGASLSPELKELFEATRRKFIDNAAEIGIANRSVRLRKLNRIADRAEEAGAHVIVIQACEAAAKEMGGAFTNKRELSGKIDAKVEPGRVVILLPDNGRGDYDFSRYSTEQLLDMYQRAARNEIEFRPLPAPASTSDTNAAG